MKRLLLLVCFISFNIFVLTPCVLAVTPEVFPNELSVSLAPGGDYETTIYIIDTDNESTDFPWQLSSDVSWVRPETVSGQGPTAVKITITSENPSETEGHITVYFQDAVNPDPITITIKRQISAGPEGEFSFFLSPSLVNMEISRPQIEEPKGFQVGVSCLGKTEGVQCSVGTNQSWLEIDYQVDPTSRRNYVPCDSSFTVGVDPDLDLPQGSYQGQVMVVCNGIVQTVQVNLKINDKIGNQLIISPRSLEVRIAKAELLPRTFVVKIANANPEEGNFSFRAQSEAPWIRVEPQEGFASSKEGTTVSLIIDPSGLPAGQYQGSVRFFSDLDEKSANEGQELTVFLTVLPWHTFEVFPQGLFWSLERSEDGSLNGAYPQRIHIYASSEGWSLATDTPWITLSSLWSQTGTVSEGTQTESTSESQTGTVSEGTQTESTSESQTGTVSEGYFEVSLNTQALAGFAPGIYHGEIRLTAKDVGFLRRIPVIVQIRDPGDEVVLPATPPIFTQLVPWFARISAAETSPISLRMPAAALPETPEDCELLAGKWENDNCVFHNRVYFLVRSPSLWPGMTFVWRPFEGKFVLIEKDGVPVPGADELYSAIGPMAEISFGPVKPLGLSGEIFFEVRTGKNFSSAKTLQEILLEVFAPAGKWRITDYFNGQPYLHPEVLSLWREDNGWAGCLEYEGSCLAPVRVIYGDGQRFLYQFIFDLKGYYFEYEIKRLDGEKMSGQWRFFNGRTWSSWQSWQAERASLWSITN